MAYHLETSTFLPDLYHSFPIPSLWRVAPKIAVSCKMIVFPGPCFAFWSLIVMIANIVIYVPENRAANIRRITIDSPMLAIRRAPADHNTEACCLGPTVCNIEIRHFYHRWYIVAIPDPGVVFDLRIWHRCDHEQSYWLFINSVTHKRKKNREVNLNLSFDVVKVSCPTFIYLFMYSTSQATRVDCLKDFFQCQLKGYILYLT